MDADDSAPSAEPSAEPGETTSGAKKRPVAVIVITEPSHVETELAAALAVNGWEVVLAGGTDKHSFTRGMDAVDVARRLVAQRSTGDDSFSQSMDAGSSSSASSAVYFQRANVSSLRSVEKLAMSLRERYSRIDALIFSGQVTPGSSENLPQDVEGDYDAMLVANCLSPLAMTLLLLKQLGASAQVRRRIATGRAAHFHRLPWSAHTSGAPSHTRPACCFLATERRQR